MEANHPKAGKKGGLDTIKSRGRFDRSPNTKRAALKKYLSHDHARRKSVRLS
jgi:hypothetical protein